MKRSVADFKSGLSIIKSLLNLLYVVMTITVMVGAASMIDVHAVFAWIVIVISLVFSVLKLSFGIALLVFKRIILPKMAKKGSYTLYSVVGGKVTESKRINGLLKKLSAKFKKED